MKKILTLSALLMFGSSVVWAHGGGCKSDSPYGQCCHIDKKKGYVHCH